ncbi:unnamed protein product [Amaranthus hypochondriacus]
MAELACLRRSFSNPSEASPQLSEGDPLRALGESISFGRYMSETLAWEKWSTFSHNRYLEEAEKSSKPGSVAKMKAYFEAHYKKIGAKKEAVLQQANNDSNYVESEVDDPHNMELVSSLSSPTLIEETVIPNESPKKDIPDVEETLPNVIVSLDDINKTKESQNEKANIVEPRPSVIVDSNDMCTRTEESQNEKAKNMEPSLDVNSKENLPEVQMYPCEDAEVNVSTTESSVEIKLNQSTGGLENAIILASPEKEMTIEKETKKDNKLGINSKQKLTDLSVKSSKKSNISKLSSSLARLASPVRPKKEGSGNQKLVEKNKSTSKLVQMSINIESDTKSMKKSPVSRKSGIGKVFTPLGKIIRGSFVTPAPSTSRASVTSVTRHPSATPLSETRRTRIALEKSFTRNRTSDQKLQSPSVRNMKSPAKTSVTFSPFSFRTEERAAKRREFFEKRLEREAEKQQLLDKAKVNPKADFRKLSQSVSVFNAAMDTRREVLSDKTKKIPLAPPQPPKSGKPSTNLERGKCSQPPRSSSKSVSANSKSIPAILPAKKRHENSSPNIL